MLKKSLNFLPNIFGNIYFKHFVYCLSWSRLFRELLYSEMSHSNLCKSHKKYGPSLIKSIMPNNNNGLHFYNLYLHGLKYTLFWFQFLIPRTTMSQWMKCEVLNIDNFYSILLTFTAFVFVFLLFFSGDETFLLFPFLVGFLLSWAAENSLSKSVSKINI